MDAKKPLAASDKGSKNKKEKSRQKRHPLIGCMKGTIKVTPGVDLTEPADPEWADRLDRQYGGSRSSR
jgi:hypothetical protein